MHGCSLGYIKFVGTLTIQIYYEHVHRSHLIIPLLLFWRLNSTSFTPCMLSFMWLRLKKFTCATLAKVGGPFSDWPPCYRCMKNNSQHWPKVGGPWFASFLSVHEEQLPLRGTCMGICALTAIKRAWTSCLGWALFPLMSFLHPVVVEAPMLSPI